MQGWERPFTNSTRLKDLAIQCFEIAQKECKYIYVVTDWELSL
jgi:hypothetical protein